MIHQIPDALHRTTRSNHVTLDPVIAIAPTQLELDLLLLFAINISQDGLEGEILRCGGIASTVNLALPRQHDGDLHTVPLGVVAQLGSAKPRIH
jgi:hypothetical protein